ncbi:MAG: efflux RND transporter periplasmic adaptor subunit [Ardenticatenia bacterium]|nr:efflux RND transporter periplasmic adaptor subunit [Ardenticatenia bacterium]
MTLRRLFVATALLLAVGLVGLWYWQGRAETASPPPATPVPTIAGDVPDIVTAEGVVVPARRARLAFAVGGLLEERLVEEGERVVAGTPLANLASPQFVRRVEEAQAALAVARAQLAQAEAGARPEEIAAAEAALAAAQAQLDSARAQRRQAQAALEEARARLRQAERGPTEEERRIALARLRQAQAALKQAQAAYDQVAHRADIAALPQSRALEEATLAVEIARAEYDRLLKGATEEELDQLRAAVGRAEAGVEAAAASVRAAEAAVAQAQARLEQLRQGATEEELAVLRNRVRQAQVALDQARALVGFTRLVAPFDGTLTQWLVRKGEAVVPNQPVALFGDVESLQVETSDLGELDVVNVQEGQPAEVTFDALPDIRVPGRVLAVRQVAEEQRGETTYTVLVGLDSVPEGLRWGMTAVVDIFVKASP